MAPGASVGPTVRDPGRVVILGAGPTGLGAAYRLHELGCDRFSVLERRRGPGGLASSIVDDAGFTWDFGGHVQFSHYAYYDALCDRALGDAWLHHERESWVWIRNRFVPYPFQYNIGRLDPADRDAALRGLERAAAARCGAPRNFGEWILATFGAELSEIFFQPYNRKVWGYPPETMDVGWMGERVAVPDVERVRRNIREGRDEVSWGPNNTFRFPLRGGTGAIWSAVAGLLPADRLHFESEVVAIEAADRMVVLRDGRRLAYDALISSIPLNALCALCRGLPATVRTAGQKLVHSAVHIVGVGLRGEIPETLSHKCWMYFPESHSPHYRVTVFSNYSPHHVPGEDCWSLMAEVCESPHRPADEGLPQRALEAMRDDRLVPEGAELLSLWHHREEHGYPTPFLGRNDVLGVIQPALEALGIYSRGRFGAWLYEVSNQDHSCMQGVELVDRLLGSGPGDEPTMNRPDHANSGVFASPRPGR